MDTLKKSTALFEDAKAFLTTSLDRISLSFSSTSTDVENVDKSSRDLDIFNQAATEIESLKPKAKELETIGADLLSTLEVLGCQDTAKGKDLKQSLSSLPSRLTNLSQLATQNRKKLSDAILQSLHESVIKKKEALTCLLKNKVSLDGGVFISQIQSHGRLIADIEKLNARISEIVIKCTHTEKNKCKDIQNDSAALVQISQNHQKLLESVKKYLDDINSLETWVNTFEQSLPKEVDNRESYVPDVRSRYEEGVEKMKSLDQLLGTLGKHSECRDHDKLSQRIADINDVWANSRKRALSILEKAVLEDKLSSTVKQSPVRAMQKDWSRLTVVELKRELSKRKLITTGRKAELVLRIEKHQREIVRHTSNEEAKEPTESETAEKNLTEAASNILDKTGEPQKMVKLKEDIPEENVKSKTEGSHQELSDKKSSIHTEEDQISKTGELDDKSTERCQNNKSIPEISANEMTKGLEIIETETESVPISREEHRDPPDGYIPDEIPDLVIDLGEDNPIVTRNTASNKDTPYDLNEGKEMDHDGEKPVFPDRDSLVYPDTGMTLVLDRECHMVPDVETTEVKTEVVQNSKTTAVPDVKSTVVQDVETTAVPDVKTTVDPDVQTTVIKDGKIKRAPKVKAKVVPDGETKVTPNIKTTVAQNRKTIVDPEKKNTVVLDGKTTVAANVKTAVVPDVNTPVASSEKIPSCRSGGGRDMLLGLEEALKFENPSGFEKRAEKVERLVSTSKPDNLTLVVYPITLEDYAHPIILEAACRCYSLNSVHHNIAEDMYAEPLLVGLLHLHFKMEADLLTYANKLKFIKDNLEVFQASETPGRLKSFNKEYLPSFMEKPAVLLRGSLPFFIEEDDLWEIFPRAHRVCILQSDPDPKSRLGGRHGNVMFASKDALQKNLDWLDSHKPRDALSTLKFYNFTEVAKVMRAPQAKGSAAEPPSSQISTPTSVTRSLLKAKPDPLSKSQSSAADHKPPPHPASKPVTNPRVNQSLNPTQPLGQSKLAASKATGKDVSNTASKAASKAATEDDSKAPNNTYSKNVSKAVSKDAIKADSKDASKPDSGDAINDASKDGSNDASNDASKADSKAASKAANSTPTSVSGGLTRTPVSGRPLSIFDGVANQEQDVSTSADAGLKKTPLSSQFPEVLPESTPADMNPDKNIYDDISDEDFDVGRDNGPSDDEDVQIHKKQHTADKRPAAGEPIVTRTRKQECDGKDYEGKKRLKEDDNIRQMEVTIHTKYDDATAESKRTFNDRREVLRTLFIHNIVPQVFNESEFKAWVTKSLRQLGHSDVEDPIIEIRFGSPQKGFGFVVFRDKDLATKALQLNNLHFQGRYVRLARPKRYPKYAKQHANQDQRSINEEKRNIKREMGTREHHYSNKDSSAKSKELHSRRQRWRHLWKKAILKVLIVIQMEKKNQSLQDAVLTGGSDVDMRLPKAAKVGDIPDYMPSGGSDVDMRLVEAASAGAIPDAVPYGGSDVDMRLLEAAKAGRIPDAVPSDVDMRLLKATKAGDIPNAILSDGFDVDTRLLEAAKAGDIDIIKKVVSTHPRSLNCRDGRFSTPLHLASGYNRLAVVEFLLKSGANVQAEDKGGMVPLHNACSHGHYEVTQLLIDHGACINAVDLWKFTPLHEAASKGKLEICKLLLKHGADVNKKTIPDDHTPLDLVREGDKDVADLLRAEIAKQSSKEPVDTRVKVKPRTILDDPKIADLTAESLTLRWKASDIPLYALPTPIWYIVEQREPPSLEWVKIAMDTKVTELPNVTINRNKDYCWRIRAANEFGVSEPSRPTMLKKKDVAYDTTVKVSDKQASAGKPVAIPTRKREHDNADNKDELSLKQDGGIRKKQKSKRIKSDNAQTPNTNLHRKKVVLQTLFVYNIRPQFQEDKFKAWVSYSLKQLDHSDVEDPIIDITFGTVQRKFILVMFRTEDLATKALKLNGRCFQGVCLLVERHKEYAGFRTSDQTSTNEEKMNVEQEKASTITTDSTANQIPTVVRQRKQEDGKSDAVTSSVVTKTISQAQQVQPLTELATPLQSGIPPPQGLPPPMGMPPPSLANNPVQPLHPSPQTKAPRQQVQTKHEASSATPTVQTQASEMRQQVQAKIQTSSPIPPAQTQTSASGQTVQAKHQASSATPTAQIQASETKQQGQTGAPRQEGQTKPQAIEVTPLGRKLEVKSCASEKPVPTKYQASNIIPLVQTQDSDSGQQVQTVPQAIEVTPLGRNPKVKSTASSKQVKTPFQASNVISLVQIEDSSLGQEVKTPYPPTSSTPLGQHLQVQPSASEQLVPTQYQASNITSARMPPPWFDKVPVHVTYPPPQPSALGQQMQMQYQASTASTLVQSQTSASGQLVQMPYQGINVPPQALVQTPSASGQTPYQAINVPPQVQTPTSASGYTPYQAVNVPPHPQVLTQTSAPGQNPYQASYLPPPAAQVLTQPPSQAYSQYQPSQMTSQWQTPYQAVSQTALPTDQKQFYKAPLPQPSKYVYDAASGYHYDPTSNLYYDERTQRFYSTVSLQFWVYDYKKETYIPAPNQEFPPHGMPSTTPSIPPPHGVPLTTPSIPPPYGTPLTTQATSLPYGTASITTTKPDEQATYNWSTFKPKGHDKDGSIHHRRHDRTRRKYSSAHDDYRSSATSISSDSSFSDDDWRKDRSRSPDSRGSKKYRSTERGRASREYRRRGDRSRSPVSRSPEDSRPRDWERSSQKTEPGTTSTAVARPRDESSLIPAGASSLQILSLMARSSLQLRNSRRSDISPLRERSRRSVDSPPRGRSRMSDGSPSRERSRRSDFSPLSERSRIDFSPPRERLRRSIDSPPRERLRRRSDDSPPRRRLRRSIDSPPRERLPDDSYHKRLSDDSYIRDSSRIVTRDEFPSSSELSHGGKSLRRPLDMVTSLASDQMSKRSIEGIPWDQSQERPGPSGLSADDLRFFLHNRDDRPGPDRPYRDVRLVPKRPDSDRKRSGSFSRDKMPKSPDSEDSCRESESELLQQYQFLKESLKNLSRHIPKSDRDKLLQESRDLDDISD